MKFWLVIGNGVIAGIAAGLVLAILILAFSTPLILKAEKYEGHLDSQHNDQRNLGTLIGTIIISIVYGLIMSAIYTNTAKKTIKRPLLRGLLFGLIGYLILAFVPALAFLPNPPGVEAKASATVRQVWWFLIIAVELIGALIYFLILRYLKSANKTVKHLLGLITFGLIVMVPFIMGPPNAIGESLIPANLLINFRLVSLLTLLAFWVILGITAGWLSKRSLST